MNSSFFMHLPLPVDQIGRRIHQIQNTIDRLIPIPQQILLVLNRPKINHPIYSINSARDGLRIVQTTDLLLAVVPIDVQQLTHSVKRQLAVVLADYSHVVLNQHPLEFIEVLLGYNIGTLWFS